MVPVCKELPPRLLKVFKSVSKALFGDHSYSIPTCCQLDLSKRFLLLLLLLFVPICCRDTIIARIEQLAFDLISGVAAGQLPTLTCISTARSNVHMAPCNSLATQAGASTATQALDCGSDQEPDVYGSDNTAAGGGFGGVSQQQEEQEEHVLRLGSKVQVKSLLTSAGAQTNSIVRGECGAVCSYESPCLLSAQPSEQHSTKQLLCPAALSPATTDMPCCVVLQLAGAVECYAMPCPIILQVALLSSTKLAVQMRQQLEAAA